MTRRAPFSFADMIGAAAHNEDDDRPIRRDPAIEAEVLRDLARSFLAPQEPFKVGDVVTWKDGLRNCHHPLPDEPAIVVGFQPEVAEDVANAGAGYEGAMKDVIIMVRVRGDEGDSAGTYGLDSRRLRLMTEDELRIVSVKSAA